ncbi:unnamed protein product [Brassica oleracea]
MLRVYAAVDRKHCSIFYYVALLPHKYGASCLGQSSLIQPQEPLSRRNWHHPDRESSSHP